jgi:hypothetical protein
MAHVLTADIYVLLSDTSWSQIQQSPVFRRPIKYRKHQSTDKSMTLTCGLRIFNNISHLPLPHKCMLQFKLSPRQEENQASSPRKKVPFVQRS